MNKASEFVPLGDRLLVKPDEREQVTTAGIHLPDSVGEKPLTGRVVARGQDVVADELVSGSQVMFSKWGGTEVPFEEGAHLIVREADVMGVLGVIKF